MAIARTLLMIGGLAGPVPALADDLFRVPRDRMMLFSQQVTYIDRRRSHLAPPADPAALVTEAVATGPVAALPAAAAKAGRRIAAQVKAQYPAGDKLVLKSRRLRGPHLEKFIGAAKRAAGRHRIPEELFLRLVQQESGWNSKARSPVGAIGLAQLMPGTARDLRVNPHDPVQNLEGGARYLRQQFDKFRDWRLALAAYNAGPGAVRKYGGVPPYKETRKYVQRILGS